MERPSSDGMCTLLTCPPWGSPGLNTNLWRIIVVLSCGGGAACTLITHIDNFVIWPDVLSRFSRVRA